MTLGEVTSYSGCRMTKERLSHIAAVAAIGS